MKYSRNDADVLNRAHELFQNLGNRNERSKKKVVKLIADTDFLMAIFNPQTTETWSKAECGQKIAQIYDAATTRKAVSELVDALDDYGYGMCCRASAAFLANIVNLGMAAIDDKATALGQQKDHKDISSSDFNDAMHRLEKYQDNLNDILKICCKIEKAKGKVLSAKTGLPRQLCVNSLFSVPGVNYVQTAKIGFYLKTVVDNIYGFVNYNHEDFDCDYDEIDWGFFFKAIFGSERIPDVASLILLEGAERIEKYDNYREVRAVWDAITQFALKALNKAPASIRDQMIQLYLKRLNKMMADHNVDLRIDLRHIDALRFDNLVKTIDKYRDTINSIMSKAKSLANATAETAPV